MHALIYLSNISQPLDKDDVIEIATKASIKNKRIGVTGFLSSRGSQFIQYLEGESETIMELIQTIENDPRHDLQHTIHLRDQTNRHFANWSMRLITSDDESRILPDDTLISAIRDIANSNYEPEMVDAQIYTIINRISRILYMPRYDSGNPSPIK